jgi:hypothetical protein
MKSLRKVLAWLALAAYPSGAAVPAVADPIADRAMAFFASINAGDWAAIESLVADDFVSISPGSGFAGRAEYLSDLRGAPAALGRRLAACEFADRSPAAAAGRRVVRQRRAGTWCSDRTGAAPASRRTRVRTCCGA